MELGPHPGLAPFAEPPVGRRPRGPERRRQLPPSTARCGYEDDRRQNLAVSVPPSATALWPRGSRRHNPLEQFPQLIRHQTLNDSHDARLSNTPNETTSRTVPLCTSFSACPRAPARAGSGVRGLTGRVPAANTAWLSRGIAREVFRCLTTTVAVPGIAVLRPPRQSMDIALTPRPVTRSQHQRPMRACGRELGGRGRLGADHCFAQGARRWGRPSDHSFSALGEMRPGG